MDNRFTWKDDADGKIEGERIGREMGEKLGKQLGEIIVKGLEDEYKKGYEQGVKDVLDGLWDFIDKDGDWIDGSCKVFMERVKEHIGKQQQK